jgi:hypothetical protein
METSLREFAEFQDADEVLLFERATFLGIFINVSAPYSFDTDTDPYSAFYNQYGSGSNPDPGF